MTPDLDMAKRVAARLGLHFHICNERLYEHRGHRSEDRDATEYEVEMWDLVLGRVSFADNPTQGDPRLLEQFRCHLLSEPGGLWNLSIAGGNPSQLRTFCG